MQARIKQAGFPVQKDLEAFDVSAAPGLSKPKILELARCGWIEQHQTCCLLGSSGTGKSPLAFALGLSACRLGKRVHFVTGAAFVNRLEESQKQYQFERFLKQLDTLELLICDELGHLSFNRSGAEVSFQVFAERYERASLLITSNLPFQRMAAGVPRRADDSRSLGPADPPLRNLGDEW